MSYSYWLNFNKAVPSWSEFWPNEEPKATKKRPSGMEFYREDVSEIKISRTGPGRYSGQSNATVYDALETWFFDATKFDDEIEIEIYRGDRTGTLYFAGYFSICDATIDQEYKTFKITPLIDDAYRSFIEVGEVDFDVRTKILRDWLSKVDVIIPVPQDLETWVVTAPAMGFDDDFNTFTVGATENELDSVIDSDALEKQARRSPLSSAANGDVFVIIIKNYTLNSGTAPYLDILKSTDGSSLTTGAVRITANGTYVLRINATGPYDLTLYTSPANQVTNVTFDIYLYAADGVHSNAGNTYMDFIEDFIVGAMGLSYTGKVKSTFLENDALPTGAPSSIVSFMTTNPSGNYVSGVTASNTLNNFVISETRNWVDADAVEILVSFNNLMSDLKETLQAAWFIDADGNFRIEHIKYFEKLVDDSTALDLTGATYDKYKAETGAREMAFNKGMLANREQFRWQQVGSETDSEDFVGVDIIYDNLETIANVITHEARNITTDVTYILANPTSASASGLTYLDTFSNAGDAIVRIEAGVLSGDDIINGHFSWANLQDKYWTWRRMSENGDMNDGDTTSFDSAVKFLEQSNVKFGYQSTLDGFTKITTLQGTGQQVETVRDLDSDFVTMLIAYNPYE